MNAYITVRKGSQRIPNKNLRPFVDTNLLQNKISTLKECKRVDDILVTSNCEESLSIAEKNGCLLDVRPEKYCSSETQPKDLYKYMAQVLSEKFPDDRYFLSASVCYPLISPNSFDSMIKLFLDNYNPDLEGYSSLNWITSLSSCHSVKENLWERSREIIYLDRDGPLYSPSYEALNYTPGEQPASQDLPDIVSVAFGSIITSIRTLEEGDLVGEFPEFYDLPKYESVDIDEEEDFVVAEALYKHFKNK
jgi:N-acylneuraminate cytidylyltransferase